MGITHEEMHGQGVQQACRIANHNYATQLSGLLHHSHDCWAPEAESGSNHQPQIQAKVIKQRTYTM